MNTDGREPVRKNIADIIKAHPYSSGDGSAEELAEAIMDGAGPSVYTSYAPTLGEVVEEIERLRNYKTLNGGNMKRTDREIDDKLDAELGLASRRASRLLYAKKLRVSDRVKPNWWRDALLSIDGRERPRRSESESESESAATPKPFVFPIDDDDDTGLENPF